MMLYQEQVEEICEQHVTRYSRLSGGMIGDIFRVWLEDQTELVAKVSAEADSALDIEGRMLLYLAEHTTLTIPQVLFSQKHLLLMTYIPNSGGITGSVQREAAEEIAALHNISGTQYGLEFDTLIGSLHQPNPQSTSWIEFFRDHRLLYMADVAYNSGSLSLDLRKRIDRLAARLGDFLYEPEKPSLIHGDLWGGNVLAMNGAFVGVIDPAIYYADPEIELAFSTLFGTFGEAFFERYQQIRPIREGFFETRRDLYNLYPLLVHVRLFGGSYAHQIQKILRRAGIA